VAELNSKKLCGLPCAGVAGPFNGQIMWQNIASRSFGSNQVLLGGMMPPASAMLIRSSMLVGNRRERAGVFAAVHQLFQFRRAADAADEIDALARARIVNAEDRREHVLLQQRHVERSIGSLDRGERRLEGQRVPLALEIKAQFMLARGAAHCRGGLGQNRARQLFSSCSGVRPFKSFSTRL
jgi:hypothetical protein